MSRTDLISDAFTTIRNASLVRKEKANIPASKLLGNILGILKSEGYISNYKFIETKNKQGIFCVYLKYRNKVGVISKIQKASHPGRRKYLGYKDIKPVLNGMGIAIISTSKGIMADKQCREQHLGGEVVGIVW